MIKKILAFFLTAAALLLAFTGCTSEKNEKDSADIIKEKTVVKQTMTAEEFESLLMTMPLAVTETEIILQDASDEQSVPDSLKIVLKNNTDTEIKNASVAFVAWDENDFPVKFKFVSDLSIGKYVNITEISGINMISGGIAEESGFLLPEGHGISSFGAIAVKFETFDGDVWENPYFEQFCELYEGNEYPAGEIEITILESTFRKNEEEAGSAAIRENELNDALSQQPLAVTYTEYVVQNEELRTIYPDMLKAVLKNNTEEDIVKVTVAFAAWDENGLPVRIIGQLDFEGGEYIKQADFEEILIKSGETYEEGCCLLITETNEISEFRAIALSYETVSGKKWKNPCFEQFCELYEEKKLEIIQVG